ncbi:hypothetical protein OE88DRAFT_1285046 [Heliocybe sulcata]|uniref:Uncharacterized protein n=1 Tax=Heliocybe sulcata TaxID=5364 RepID=A0A5C3NBK1_9AGAM|nr:hypothetical protein OE88DRAFT_1285046 [Heliocybe sulcata]
MGQYWIIVNIDAKTYMSFSVKKLGEWLLRPQTGLSMMATLVPPLVNTEDSRLDDSLIRSGSSDNELGQLSLPTELLGKIFEELDDDVFHVGSLCLANSTLWTIGYSYFIEAVGRHTAHWGGDRVICVGDYAEDLPDGILSKEEMDNLETDSAWDGSLYHYAWEEYDDYELQIRSLLVRVKGHIASLQSSPSEMKAWQQLITPLEELLDVYWTRQDYLRDDQWILCNLSQKEYARGAYLKEMVGDALSLGDVVLSQICWSQDPSTALRYKGNIYQGRWAGDRFAVYNRDVFEGRDDRQDWEDVSQKVIGETLAIRRAEYGKRWPVKKHH